ncbi:MAG: hypothetical protein LBM28_05110 [Oscillospiraceae bacterium]|jgi:hypothetical protein|nr:hypothetical protein [Oscillospiraceae bacterium]
MVKFTKKFIYYSLLIISIVSFVNCVLLLSGIPFRARWIPAAFPLSLFSITGFAFAAIFAQIFYPVAIALTACILLFLAAFSFRKQRLVLPIVSFAYSLFDFVILNISFWDHLTERYFVPIQLLQIVTGIILLTFMAIYFVCYFKSAKQSALRKKPAQA